MSNRLIAARDRFSGANAEERVWLDGREWGVIRAGDAGPALVLIPGTLGRADIFWQQIEALKDRARLMSLTYPAKGGIAEWSGDVAALMDRAGMAEATVLGSSLGGYLAQYFAGKYPGRTHGTDRGQYARFSRRADARAALQSRSRCRAGGKTSGRVRDGPHGGDEGRSDAQDLVELLLGEVEGRIPEAEMRARLKALKHGPELPLVSLPKDRIVTIEAADDPLIPAPMREAVREALEPGKAFHFTSGGHFPYVVRPAVYTALIEERLGLEVTGEIWPDAAWSEL